MFNIINEHPQFENKANGINFAYKRKNKLKRKDFYADNSQNNNNIEFNYKLELNPKKKNEKEFQIIQKECFQNKENYNLSENKIKNLTSSSILKKSSYTNKSIINSTIFNDKKDNNMKLNENYNKDENENIELNNRKENIFLQLYGFQSLNSDEENFDNYHKRKGNKSKKIKKTKWNEEEYQNLKNNDYIPFNGYDIEQYLFSLTEINNIRQMPEIYNKYNYFLKLIKEQDKFIKEQLLKNILYNFKNIYKHKNYYGELIINSLLQIDNLTNLEYNSTKSSACFDLFISFIYMFIKGFDNKIVNSKNGEIKLNTPLQSLAYLFTYKIFSFSIAKLIHIYYNRFLSYKIENILFNNKEKEYYRYRINSRKIIWKQFEVPYLYFKNSEKLFSKYNNGYKINENKIQKFSIKIRKNVNCAYKDSLKNIKIKHKFINTLDINDDNINITNSNASCPSSLYNQIKNDIMFIFKMNLYKYYIKKMRIKKMILIHEEYFIKNDFKNKIKNKIFNQSIFFMNSNDIIFDFFK